MKNFKIINFKYNVKININIFIYFVMGVEN